MPPPETMKANKTYQVQQHGRKTEYKTKTAALKLADELAIYNDTDNVSVYEYNHNTGIYTEIYTRECNHNNSNTMITADNTTLETTDTMNTETKTMTVKRSDWNETAKRLECAGWFYIGTPTATGKTIYRRGGSELEIIIEEHNTTNTPETMNETKPVEFSEFSHAAQCTDIYLHNTAEIYERYTVKAVARVVKAIKAGEYVSNNPEQITKDIQEITPAINAAVKLVKKYDHMTPTAKDIEQVTRNYIAYIVESAEYEAKNA